ncbi:Lon protease family protein [Desulfovibrio ferrophilus]|uniref:endopeptidase La n=1 Tax=Desulfovibrio ferrophilus TaxID=241368 RepID=A0A2Z6B1Y6_9BACT|nr:ATP-binding protein [Desulfovibrio ferrophilus]BBD09491.1 peptidase S16, lon domain protein [Desulfovibrio ferrophilus]
MPKPKALPAKRLRATLAPERIPYADSNAISEKTRLIPSQPRALMALETGLSIDDPGFNVFVAGEANLGRTYLVTTFLEPRAARMPVPDDLLYVHNFMDQDKPQLLSVPAGRGKRLKKQLADALAAIRKELPKRMDEDSFVKKRDKLARSFADRREDLLRDMEALASKQGFELDMDEQGGMTLYPLVEGKVVSEADYDRLEPRLRKTLKTRGDSILTEMTKSLRLISKEEQDFQEDQRSLEKSVLGRLADKHLNPLFQECRSHEGMSGYLKAVRKDILESLDNFMPQPEGMSGLGMLGMPDPASAEDFFGRYDVNRFVDNCCTKGAPIVIEDHPTLTNLLGCIEREAEMGALYTDFSLIKSGALHKANGGFLVLRMEDLVQNPDAWDGLLRALRAGKARIEDPGESQEHSRARTIQPEPIPLDVRVILVGSDMIYEALLDVDDRFPKLFKLKAHMQDNVPRNATSIRQYVSTLGRIIRKAELLPFDRGALAGLVDYASAMAEDQKQLSLRFPQAREVMIEAAALARKAKLKVVGRKELDKALANRKFRANLYEEEFLADYDRELIKVSTTGQAVGRANGLAVVMYGDHEFGLTHQIACTVGVGHGGIIDLEREAELGGPIHTKGMMILKSYLLGLFAQDKPLVMTGSLAFEQSYAGIEGDSASGAELAALLSALADVPVNLSLSFTGAVSQSGAIMAVGGVTSKIEGFFKICKRRKLTGKQGVIMPKDNVDHLMLSDEVCAAVDKGLFHIYPVTRIEEAMELLTGLPAGRKTAKGKFPTSSLYHRVDGRLAELAELADTSK